MKVKTIKTMFITMVILLMNSPLFSQSIITKDGLEQTECSNAEFIEEDGILIAEVESINHGSGWRGENLIDGYTGTSYIKWAGGDKFNNPGSGLTEFKIKINNPGTYHFRWHSKITHGTEATESNDSWLRIPDASDFFAQNGSSIKYPNGGMFVQSNVITNGSSKNGWMKVYSSGTTSWTWSCRTSDNDPHEIYATFDTAGVYTVQISGRSNNHAIDRFVLFNDDEYSIAQATNEALEETMCPNLTEIRYTVVVNSGTGSGSFTTGSEITIVANSPASNKIFDKWTGDTTHIDDMYSPTTQLIIPESDVIVTANYKDIVTTSVLQSNKFEAKIYPNPTSESFYIELPTNANSTIQIYSFSGKRVYNSDGETSTVFIDSHNLTSGAYFVRISNGLQTHSEVIIIN